jgi:DNA-binding winged helix-turn-helix (wHTH) protein
LADKFLKVTKIDYKSGMNKPRFAFGSFELDTESGLLLRQSVPVPASYRGLLVLAVLLARPGDVLSKSDLMEAAWPGTAVEEGNLSVQIAGLRKLLGPAPDGGAWIKTISRVGYRFTGVVEKREKRLPRLGKYMRVLNWG